jgi:hypothetical protein
MAAPIARAAENRAVSGATMAALREDGRLSLVRFPIGNAREEPALAPLLNFVAPLESLVCDEAHELGRLYKGMVNGTRVAMKMVDPTRETRKGLLPVHEPARQVCAVLREILIHIYCAHPAVLTLHAWNCDTSASAPCFLMATELMKYICTLARVTSSVETQRG